MRFFTPARRALAASIFWAVVFGFYVVALVSIALSFWSIVYIYMLVISYSLARHNFNKYAALEELKDNG